MKIAYSLWRDRRDSAKAQRQWEAMGEEERAAWTREFTSDFATAPVIYRATERYGFRELGGPIFSTTERSLEQAIRDIHAIAIRSGERITLKPTLVYARQGEMESFESCLLPTMTEPNTVNWFSMVEVHRPLRRLPGWLPLWLRHAIIRAIPSCTLWEPMSWRDSTTMTVWPHWTVDRYEMEDTP